MRFWVCWKNAKHRIATVRPDLRWRWKAKSAQLTSSQHSYTNERAPPKNTAATMVMLRLLLLVSSLWTTRAQTSGANLVEKINARAVDDADPDSLSQFRNALHATGLLDSFLGNHSASFTVFAPSNQAFKDDPLLQLYMTGLDEKPYPRWHQNLKNAMKQHIVVTGGNETFLYDDIFDLTRESLISLRDPIVINQFETKLQDATFVERNVTATNGVLHVINKVLRPLFFDQTFAQLELQSELGPDVELNRTSMTVVVDAVNARERLNHENEAGLTFIGCRIRAFKRPKPIRLESA